MCIVQLIPSTKPPKSTYLNQFIQPHTVVPDPSIPEDWNKYAYVRDNPINYTDPSGHITEDENQQAITIVNYLKAYDQVTIDPDWGSIDCFISSIGDPFLHTNCWGQGAWTLEEQGNRI